MNTDEKSKIEQFVERAQEYLKTREELGKLKALDKASAMASAGMSGMIVFSFFLLVILFASIALAFTAASLLGSSSAGFGAVALIYLVIGFLLAINKDRWLKRPIANAFIKHYFKSNSHETD
jgi:hypothetical protein